MIDSNPTTHENILPLSKVKFLRNIAQLGSNIILHTGLFAISSTLLFTTFWSALYFIV